MKKVIISLAVVIIVCILLASCGASVIVGPGMGNSGIPITIKAFAHLQGVPLEPPLQNISLMIYVNNVPKTDWIFNRTITIYANRGDILSAKYRSSYSPTIYDCHMEVLYGPYSTTLTGPSTYRFELDIHLVKE